MIRKISLDDEKQYNELGQELNENFSKLFDLNNELSKDYSHIYIYQIETKWRVLSTSNNHLTKPT